MNLLTGVGGKRQQCELAQEPWFLICPSYQVLDDAIRNHELVVEEIIDSKWNSKKLTVNTNRSSGRLKVEMSPTLAA